DSAPVADAMFVAAQYMIKSTASVSAIKVMLANGSVVGGEMYGSIIDTVDFLANNPTPIYNTLPSVIEQFNLDAGYILLNFVAPVSLAPGAYYAAAELYSNANFADIRILDDRTVEEPSTASMIYLPGTGLNTSYTNGTAFGVRLLMEGFVDDLGINDVSLDGISVYPNPSEGIVNISNDNNNDNIITVYDMLGKVVYSTTSNTKVSVDLSANGTGVYLVKVSNENGSVVERVVIK
ncbi:MAG: T9SS type A sorting domain-containing protein, partial [Flavobacteriales bacterium]